MLFSPLLDKDDLHLSKLLQPLFDNLVHVLKLFDFYRASRSLTKTGLVRCAKTAGPLASWRSMEGAGYPALLDLVFAIFSDRSWTAFGRRSECSPLGLLSNLLK